MEEELDVNSSSPPNMAYTQFLETYRFGFSTGALHREFSAKQALAFLGSIGCPVVELGFVQLDRLSSNQLNELSAADLTGFTYLSLHAPAFRYGRNRASEQIIEKIARVHRLRPLGVVVFHPDQIEDFSVLAKAPFPVGIENMDHRKGSFQTAEELERLLQAYPQFCAVLDLNHIYTIDPTMVLAQEFYRRLGSKIVELQISGYATLHDPLVTTQQQAIVEAIHNQQLPIIDEGLIDSSAIMSEIAYVAEVLTGSLGSNRRSRN